MLIYLKILVLVILIFFSGVLGIIIWELNTNEEPLTRRKIAFHIGIWVMPVIILGSTAMIL